MKNCRIIELVKKIIICILLIFSAKIGFTTDHGSGGSSGPNLIYYDYTFDKNITRGKVVKLDIIKVFDNNTTKVSGSIELESEGYIDSLVYVKSESNQITIYYNGDNLAIRTKDNNHIKDIKFDPNDGYTNSIKSSSTINPYTGGPNYKCVANHIVSLVAGDNEWTAYIKKIRPQNFSISLEWKTPGVSGKALYFDEKKSSVYISKYDESNAIFTGNIMLFIKHPACPLYTVKIYDTNLGEFFSGNNCGMYDSNSLFAIDILSEKENKDVCLKKGRVHIEDVVGNSYEKDITFYIDGNLPKIGVYSPDENTEFKNFDIPIYIRNNGNEYDNLYLKTVDDSPECTINYMITSEKSSTYNISRTEILNDGMYLEKINFNDEKFKSDTYNLVYYQVKDLAGNVSSISLPKVIVDKDSPIITDTNEYKSPSNSYNFTPSFYDGLSGIDEDSIYWCLKHNNNEIKVKGKTLGFCKENKIIKDISDNEIKLDDGKYDISVIVLDKCANQTSYYYGEKIFDTIPPCVEGKNNNNRLTVNCNNASDGDYTYKFMYKFNNKDFTTDGSILDLAIADNGEYTGIKCIVTDRAGNTTTVKFDDVEICKGVIDVDYTVDTYLGEKKITYSKSNYDKYKEQYYKKCIININSIKSPNGKTDGINYSWDNINWSGFSSTISNEINDTKNINLYVKDKYGNSNKITIPIKIDTKPEFTVLINNKEINEQSWYKSADFILEQKNTGSKLTYYVNGSKISEKYSYNKQGTSKFAFKAVNENGLETEVIKIIKIDNEPPSVEISDNGAGRKVDVTVNDNISGIKNWKIGEQNYTALSCSVDRREEIKISVEDNAGNLKEYTFKLDLKPPVIEVSKPEKKWFNGTEIINLSAQDDSDVNGDTWYYCIGDSSKNKLKNISFEIGNLLDKSGENQKIKFFVEDSKGNEGSTELSFNIDNGYPKIIFDSSKKYSNDLIDLSSISINNDVSELSEIKYFLNGILQDTVSNISSKSFTLQKKLNPEKNKSYSVKVQATNLAGNTHVTELSYVIDSIVPEISNIKKSFDKYISNEDVIICFDVKDVNLKKCYYKIKKPSSISDLVEIDSKERCFSIKNIDFEDGENVVYFYAEDFANNQSDMQEIHVYKDSQIPSEPRLSATAPLEAIVYEDTINSTSVLFNFIQPSNSGFFGIDHYECYLCSANEQKENDKASYIQRKNDWVSLIDGQECRIVDNKGLLSVSDLKDSFADDFYNGYYYLVAFSVGKSGLKSIKPLVYRFRVDTTPPKNLRIIISNQQSKEKYYNWNSVTLNWIKPIDLTGVKEYQLTYSINDSTGNIIKNDSIKIDGASSSYIFGLHNLIKDGERLICDSGIVDFLLVPYDFSGNKGEKAQTCFKYDYKKPYFSGEISVSPEILSNPDQFDKYSVVLSWQSSVDEESGIDRIVISVENTNDSDEEISDIYLEPSMTSTNISNIRNNEITRFTVYAYDKAGNRAYIEKEIKFGNCEGKEFKAREFDQYIQNIRILGKYKGSNENVLLNEESKLFIPGDLNVYKISENNLISQKIENELEFIQLSSISIDGLDIKEVGSELKDGKYCIEVNGLKIICSQIKLSDKLNGLVLNSGCLISSNQIYDFDTICIGSPGNYQISSESDIYKQEDKSIQLELISEFEINDIERLSLENGYAVINNTKINPKFKYSYNGKEGVPFDSLNLNIIKDSNNKTPSNKFKNPFGNQITKHDDEFVVTLDSTEYHIESYGIEENIFKIYKSYIELPDSFKKDSQKPAKIFVNNFTISNSEYPDIQKGKDFNICMDNVVVAEIDNPEIRFAEGKLLISGYKNIGTKKIEIQDLRISQQGFDFENGCVIQGINGLNLFGYPVTIRNAYYHDNGNITVRDGYINLFKKEYEIKGISLNIDSEDNLSVVREYSTEVNYSPEILFGELKSLIIKQDGVYGNISVNVPTTNNEWDLKNVKFSQEGKEYPNVSFINTESNLYSLNYKGYEYSVYEIEYDGYQIISDGVILKKQFFNRDIQLSKLLINENGISGGELINAESEELESRVQYNFGGWRGYLSKLSFNENGLIGNVDIVQKNEAGNINLSFEDFEIYSDGTFYSGKYNSEGIKTAVYLNEYPFILNSASFETIDDKVVLVSDESYIPLYGSEDEELNLGHLKINIDKKGNFEAVAEEIKCENQQIIRSSNSLYVKADKIEFKEKEIHVSGDIGFRENETVKREDIVIDNRFSAISKKDNQEFIYTHNGWEIKGKGLTIDEDNVIVKENLIKFKENYYDIGQLSYNRDGELNGETTVKLHKKIDVITPNSDLLQLKFSENDLIAEICISLPEVFENKKIYFNSVHLYSDGTYFSDYVEDDIDIDISGFVNFHFDKVYLTKNGLSIFGADIVLPKLEDLHISFESFEIQTNGFVDFSHGSIDPFTLWNMEFSVDDVSLIQSGGSSLLDFSGCMTLPESMPGVFSGKSISLQNFKIDLSSGELYSLEAYLQGEYVIPFLENWSLSVTDLGLKIDGANQEPVIVLQNAALIMPSLLGIDSIAIEKIEYNLVECDFDYEKIQANLQIPVNLFGIDFMLNKIFIKKSMSVGFGGYAEFGQDFAISLLQNKKLNIKTFEFNKDMSLGDIDISLAGLNGPICKDWTAVEIKDGEASVVKTEDEGLIISVGGAIQFTASAPEFIQNKALKIDTFTIDASEGKISELSAYLTTQVNGKWTKDPEKINFDPVIFGCQFDDVFAEFDWNGDENIGEIIVSGGFVLPDSLPEGIKGSKVGIKTFKISTVGNIEEFSASYKTLKPVNIGAMELTEVETKISYGSTGNLDFDIETILTLPKEKFPEGIGGLTTNAILKFNNDGLYYVDATCNVPNQKLFGTVETRDVVFALYKDQYTDLLLKFKGEGRLPDSFPEGLRGLTVSINDFVFDVNGNIYDVDMTVGQDKINVFNVLQLNKTKISIYNEKDNNDELFIDISSNEILFVGESMPDELKSASFYVKTFELSTKRGLISFSAGMRGNVSCKVMGGLSLGLETLEFTNKGFVIGATAKLDFPNIDCKSTFKAEMGMDWDGNITKFEGGLKEFSLEVAGFTSTVQELYVKNIDGDFAVTINECRLTLPENLGSMGGASFAIKNAYFSPSSGDFICDCELPKITTVIAGFTLVLDKPTIQFREKGIVFGEVSLELPSILNSAKIALYDVEINSEDGLSFGGGGFTLPSFMIGECGFENVGAEFKLKGSEYTISGHGSMTIPGAGTLSASIGFTNISDIYPIGLKNAYFSYEAQMGSGLPLGTTGLFLTGIRGGLAFGAPDEVPDDYKSLFEGDGIRIQLGLTVGDKTGKLLTMAADTWIDVKNATFVFQGEAAILKGSFDIHAKACAILAKDVFATGVGFNLKFVKGHTAIYIFAIEDDNGKSIKFSGEGNAKFGLEEGCLYDGWLVSIPPCDIWLAEVGTKFGDFTNGKQGFYGYASINIMWIDLGTVGVFATKNDISWGCSSYDILKPKNVDLSFLENNRYNGNTRFGSNGTYVRNDIGFFNSKQYNVVIPAEYQYSKYGDDVNTTKNSGMSVGKTIFVIGYIEGDPEFTITSPSGKKFHAGDTGVQTDYDEHTIVITVDSPEAGEWGITVDNMEDGTYELACIGVPQLPEISITEPSAGVLKVNNEIYVEGNVSNAELPVVIFAKEDGDSPEYELGTVKADKDGKFRGNLAVEKIPDGTYTLIARCITSDNMYSQAVYSTGKYYVDSSNTKLTTPKDLFVSETVPGTIKATWKNTCGFKTKGYYYRSKNITEGTESLKDLGKINEIQIPYYKTGTKLEISVCAYDKDNNCSEYTEPVIITIGEEKKCVIKPKVKKQEIEVLVEKGDTAESSIFVEYDNWSDELTYITAVKKDAKENVNSEEMDFSFNEYVYESINVNLEGSVQADKIGNSIRVYVITQPDCAIGTYNIPVVIRNDGNIECNCECNIKVTVINPMPEISNINPKTINGNEENIVEIYGNGFVSGTKYYFDGDEVCVNESDTNGTSKIEVVIPKQAKRGEKKLEVVNTDGYRSEYYINVEIPDYSIKLYTTKSEITKDEEALYLIGTTSFDGYDKDISFTVEKGSDVFDIQLPVILCGNNGVVKIKPRQNIGIGKYTVILKADNGKTVRLDVNVKEEVNVPVISYITPSRIYKGSKIQVYGYGFGNQGTVKINNKNLRVSKYSNTEIELNIPENIESELNVQVITNNQISNVMKKTVYSAGYEIHLGNKEYILNAGETKEVNIAVNGYGEDIELSTSVNPKSSYAVKLSKSKVSTNAVLKLSIETTAESNTGTWDFVINAKGSGYSTSKVVTVTVKNPFEILTDNVPNGICGIPYKTELSSTEKESVYWFISYGSLPKGLGISDDGIISGIPEISGSSIFTVTSRKSNGTTAKREYVITVEAENWKFNKGDSGATRSSLCEIPSIDKVKWEKECGSVISDIYFANNYVVCVTQKGLEVFTSNGDKYWSDSSKYMQSFITDKVFYGLTDAKVLVAKNLINGSFAWKRENVSSIVSNGSILITNEENTYKQIDINTGNLLKQLDKVYRNHENIVWINNKAWEWNKNELSGIFNVDSNYVAEEEIYSVCSDNEGFVLATENNILIFDSSLNVKGTIQKQNNETVSLGMDSAGIIVKNNGYISEYDRKTFENKWNYYCGLMEKSGNNFVIANEKVCVSTDNGFAVINRYSGKEIWSKKTTQSNFAIHNNMLTISDSNKLITFDGDSNSTAPTTEIKYDIPVCDGKNSWYVTVPKVIIDATDKETYVSEKYFSINDSNYMLYTDEYELAEGIYAIKAFANDSKNQKGQIIEDLVKIDITAPETVIKVNTNESETGWISRNALVYLKASDNLSGVSHIETSNGIYEGPITIDSEGEHIINYYAVDNAGNREEKKSLLVKLDKYIPYSDINITESNGISIIDIDAKDTGSGVDYVEYCINKKSRQIYTKPIAIFESGWQLVEWNVHDKSGKESGWKRKSFYVKPDYIINYDAGNENNSGIIIGVPKKNNENLEVLENLENGSQLYKTEKNVKDLRFFNLDLSFTTSMFFSFGILPAQEYSYDYKKIVEQYARYEQSLIKNIPSIIIGCEYVQYNYEDFNLNTDSEITFYVKKDARLYVQISENTNLDNKWKKVRGYEDLYECKAKKGDFIEIKIDKDCNKLPLICAKIMY